MQPPAGQYRFFLIPPKVPMKNQATPKKYLPNFRTQKNPRIENFKPKKSFDHPHQFQPPPPPHWVAIRVSLGPIHTDPQRARDR